jgi:hypothetical protein
MDKTPNDIIHEAIADRPDFCEAWKQTSERINDLQDQWMGWDRADKKTLDLLSVIAMQHLMLIELLDIATPKNAIEPAAP